jgi:hypothetical protein
MNKHDSKKQDLGDLYEDDDQVITLYYFFMGIM